MPRTQLACEAGPDEIHLVAIQPQRVQQPREQRCCLPMLRVEEESSPSLKTARKDPSVNLL